MEENKLDPAALKNLTADQLAELSHQELDEFLVVLKAAIQAKKKEALAEIKAKITKLFKNVKEDILPYVNTALYVAAALKIFGVI